MKGLGECIFQVFKEPKIQNFGKHGATSGVYWVYYKPPVLSYSDVGTYVHQNVIDQRVETYLADIKSIYMDYFVLTFLDIVCFLN